MSGEGEEIRGKGGCEIRRERLIFSGRERGAVGKYGIDSGQLAPHVWTGKERWFRIKDVDGWGRMVGGGYWDRGQGGASGYLRMGGDSRAGWGFIASAWALFLYIGGYL